jgi:hypothetical protein
VWRRLVAVMRSRGRVDELLTHTNPCEIDLVANADLTMASSQQRASVAAKREACRAMREQARVDEEKKQAAEASKRVEAEKKREREAACKELGARLDQPSSESLSPKLASLLGKDEPFISALARGKLGDDDVTRDLSTLTCIDGEAGDAIARAFAVALAKNAESWAPDHSPSPSALALLARGKAAVSRVVRENLIPPIEKVALDALVTGKVENTTKARRKCEVLTALEVKPHLYCQAVFKSAVK